ncbi:hypothetical protein FB45DRAFT_930047 [Roridomyces roridus]|uniref:F-box domain-containing protein n=1 Tax=Roridomyces roridus TaxID=1738132 RepID=A0AAD7BGH7_9AGAR|nr:hypothetical protein FB45DRAFT_930047 [Roridomyces roridus]
MRLADIPTEIFCEILSLLTPDTILKCSSVSRTWHETIVASPALQYAIQLWKNGLIPGTDDSCSSTSKLRALDQRRRAWENLAWTSQTVVKIAPLDSCRVFELRSGMLAIQYQGPNFSTLSLQDLDADAPVHIHDLGIDLEQFEDFTIDPAQDLLVIFLHSAPGQASLLIKSLTDHQPHPLARCPTITFSAEHRPLLSSIQIADDVIGACIFTQNRFSPCFWNWRSGKQLAKCKGHTAESDFRLISSRAFIEAVPEGNGWIDLCVLDADDGEDEVKMHRIATLRLPDLSTGHSLSFASMYSGACHPRPMPNRRFSSADARRIYLLHLHYSDDEFEARLFVHHRTFYGYISQYERDRLRQHADVPWEAWGPEQTRLLRRDEHGWLGDVHGERVVLPAGDSMQLYDFSPAIVGLPKSSESVAEEGNSLHTAPTILNEPFENPVTTCLPYRSTVRRVDGNLDVLLLDQDHIVGTDTVENKLTVFAF